MNQRSGFSVGLFGVPLLFALVSSAPGQIVGNVAFFASGQQVNASQPGAITVTGDVFQQSVWVSYTNGASATGANGSSTVVEYNTQGRPLSQYSISGSVAGLEEHPMTHNIWALQNAAGNSMLTVISPRFGPGPGSPIAYEVESSTRGYRDVAFFHDQVLLSYTNPTSPPDATVQGIVSANTPFAVSDVLLAGATGINIATGALGQPTSQNDPGSLRLTPWNGVMLVSSANAQLVFIRNASTPNQAVGFLNVLDGSGVPVTGLSDAVFPGGDQDLLFLTNPATNIVTVVYVFNVSSTQLFALVDSMNALVKIDLLTGVATPILSHLNGYKRLCALQIPGEIR